MIRVTAIRGAADSPGDDIVETLLTTRAAALERARIELDSGTLQTPVRLECRYQPALLPGDLLQISDAAQGATYRATLTGIEHAGILGGALTFLTVLMVDE